VIAADTSVLVAAFARWHESHPIARGALREADTLVAHAALETFSVLTRLPPPRRASGSLVLAFLDHHFPGPPVGLGGSGHRTMLEKAAERGIVGGQVYDALVAAAAAAAGATLLTLDARASSTYALVGAEYRLLEDVM
jgi:predicted nucleic acid-binding protein